ncbi:MAG: hypothetical protein N3F64_06980 [Nitrososphaeria archaeon]|nr:hypothetical protein [Nitrososphaeria archaeon]
MKEFFRLFSFRYLRVQRILTLMLIIVLSSTLFSITALSLLGFYRGFTVYLGESEDIVALYDRRSSTPFTGLVPLYLSEKVCLLDGVLASSPEVVAPCILDGEMVFLRGIVPEDFARLNDLIFVEGFMIGMDDLNSIVVGRNLAKRLGLDVNDSVIVLGVLSDQYLELHVRGIYVSNSFLDDEVLAPLYVGQWLRGSGYAHVTLIRFKVDPEIVGPIKIFEELAKESSQTTEDFGKKNVSSAIVPSIVSRFNIEDIGVLEVSRFMKVYMERYGLSREALLILSIIIFIFSSAGVALAFRTVIVQHFKEIEVLRSLGASLKAVKFDLLAKLLLPSLASSFTGFMLALMILKLVQEFGLIRILSYTISFYLDLTVIILNFLLSLSLLLLNILFVRLEQK